VEVSLDDGETWLYCIRRFPDAHIRHGNKFWTWLHWHVDIEITHLLQAKSITVRCFNVFKNTQPKEPNWNVMGMMNNCWYIVRRSIVHPMTLTLHRSSSAIPSNRVQEMADG
jgi:nitrate reductase (NAD(P)H)